MTRAWTPNPKDPMTAVAKRRDYCRHCEALLSECVCMDEPGVELWERRDGDDAP